MRKFLLTNWGFIVSTSMIFLPLVLSPFIILCFMIFFTGDSK